MLKTLKSDPVARVMAMLGMVAVLAPVLVTLAGLRQLYNLSQQEAHVAQVEQANRALEAVQHVLLDAETGQRGYLLTADASYLAPYWEGHARLAAQFALLAQSTSAVPAQQQRLNRLQSLGSVKLAELSQTIALLDGGQRDAALAIVQGGQGQRAMASIRQLCQEMAAHEQGVLRQQLSGLQSARKAVVATLLAVVGLLFLTLGGSLAFALRELSARSAARSRLSESEHRLRVIAENLPAALAHVDGQQVVRVANQRFAVDLACLGLPAALGPQPEVPAVPLDPHLAGHLAAVNQGQRVVFEHDVWVDGRLRHFETTCFPSGQADGFFVLSYDVTERAALQAELQETKSDLLAILANSPVMISSWNLDYTNRFVNRAYAQWCGLTAEQAKGRHVADVLGAEAYAKSIDHINAALVSGRPQSFERQVMGPDGQVRHNQLDYVPSFHEGRVNGLFVFAHDITRRVRAEQAVSENAERYRLLNERTPMMIHAIDPQLRLLSVSDLWLSKMGYTRDEVIGHQSVEFLTPMSKAFAQGKGLPTLFTTGQVDELPFQMVRKDGSVFDVTLSAIAERDERGEVTQAIAVLADVTARKQAELALRESQLRLDRAVRIAGVGGWELDLRTQALTWSAQTRHIHEVDSAFVPVLDNALAFYAPQARLVMSQAIQAALDHGTPWDLELPLLTAKGRAIWVHAMGEVESDEGRAVRLAGVIQDVTEQHAQQARLNAALQEKETLLKEVYHRVKNNLQVVQSLLNLRRRHLDDGPGRTAIEDSIQHVRAMALVHEKLYQTGNLSAVSLASYTTDLLHQIDIAMGARGRRIQLSAQVDDLSAGLDQAIPFGLLVSELVTNALKHAFPQERAGQIQVRLLRLPEGGAELTVSDDGIGLPAESAQADGQASAEAGSMGLTLVATLARQLGGNLVSHPGEGTVWSTILPQLGTAGTHSDETGLP